VPEPIRVRGGAGLGDALYVRVIGEYLARQRHKVTCCSNYVDVFRGAAVVVEPFSRVRINRLAHYSMARTRADTTQWQDVCNSAKVPHIPLRFAWTVQNAGLVNDLRRRAEGRPLVVIHGGRAPFGRTDGLGIKLVPERRGFDAALGELRDCFLVRVGNAESMYPLDVHTDLKASTTVADVIDIVATCDAVVAQVSFMLPLAACLDKPLLAVWSARGLESTTEVVRQITPSKILERKESRYVMDDWTPEQIKREAGEFRIF
jgi:hypothetical protein